MNLAMSAQDDGDDDNDDGHYNIDDNFNEDDNNVEVYRQTHSLQSVERTLVCREGRVGGPLGKPGSGIFWCFSFEWDCNYMMVVLKFSLQMVMIKMQGMRLQ